MIALSALQGTESKGLWGSKRKKEEHVEEQEISVDSGFEASRRKAARAAGSTSTGNGAKTLSSRRRNDMGELVKLLRRLRRWWICTSQ